MAFITGIILIVGAIVAATFVGTTVGVHKMTQNTGREERDKMKSDFESTLRVERENAFQDGKRHGLELVAPPLPFPRHPPIDLPNYAPDLGGGLYEQFLAQ
jgi:hypothetical protein